MVCMAADAYCSRSPRPEASSGSACDTQKQTYTCTHTHTHTHTHTTRWSLWCRAHSCTSRSMLPTPKTSSESTVPCLRTIGSASWSVSRYCRARASAPFFDSRWSSRGTCRSWRAMRRYADIFRRKTCAAQKRAILTDLVALQIDLPRRACTVCGRRAVCTKKTQIF